MAKTLKAFSLATLLSIGAFIAAPGIAAADSYLGIGGGRSGPSVEFFVGDRGFGRSDRDHRSGRHHRRDRDDDRRYGRDRGCDAGSALSKAGRLGVRHARISDVGYRTIKVRGRTRGERVTLVFARVRGCPIVGY